MQTIDKLLQKRKSRQADAQSIYANLIRSGATDDDAADQLDVVMIELNLSADKVASDILAYKRFVEIQSLVENEQNARDASKVAKIAIQKKWDQWRASDVKYKAEHGALNVASVRAINDLEESIAAREESAKIKRQVPHLFVD